MSTPINFGATLVGKTQIKDNRYFIPVKRDAMIVEFDVNNSKDIYTLADVAEYWTENNDGRKMFAYDLYTTASRYRYNKPDDTKTPHFYAITTQKKNFEEINPETVVCISEFDEKEGEFNSLEYLQTNPNSIFEKKLRRKFKGSGYAMGRFLQKISDKSIEVDGLGAQEFYKKLDFVHPNENVHTSRMVWYK